MRLPKDYSSLESRGGCSGVAMCVEKITEKTNILVSIQPHESHTHLRYEREEE